MSQTVPVANDQQASACISTAVVLVSQDTTDTHNTQDNQALEPVAAATTMPAMSPTSESSPPTPSSPSPAPARPRAFYRVTRLPRGEIEHRAAMGHCTYCDDEVHSRTTCASGRLMRRVPKRVLDQRLGRSVCPFCGDPDRNKHCKATCPLRLELQEALDAKEAAFRNNNLHPAEARARRTAADATIEAIERQTERALPPPPPRPSHPNRADRSDWRGRGEQDEEAGPEEHHDQQDCKHTTPPKRKTYIKRSPMSKTNAPWREDMVPSVLVPEIDPAGRTSPAGPATEHHDLIYLGTLPHTTSAGNPFATPTDTLDVPSGTSQAGEMPPLNLLDTEVTEVVWDNIVILPNVASDSEQTSQGTRENMEEGDERSDFTIPEDTPEASDLEDLIDLGHK